VSPGWITTVCVLGLGLSFCMLLSTLRCSRRWLQGKGIKLLQGGSEAAVLRNLAGMATLQAVAQAYIPQPLLVSSSTSSHSSHSSHSSCIS
jgi:hypothetical protein